MGRSVGYRSTRTLWGQWIYIHKTLLVSVVSLVFMYVTLMKLYTSTLDRLLYIYYASIKLNLKFIELDT